MEGIRDWGDMEYFEGESLKKVRKVIEGNILWLTCKINFMRITVLSRIYL